MSNDRRLDKRYHVGPMVNVSDFVFRTMENAIDPNSKMIWTPMYHTAMIANVGGMTSVDAVNLAQLIEIYPIEHIGDRLKGDIEVQNVVIQVAIPNEKFFDKCMEELKSRGFLKVDLNCGCPAKSQVSTGDQGLSAMRDSQKIVDKIKMLQRYYPKEALSVKLRVEIFQEEAKTKFEDIIQYVSMKTGVNNFVVHCRAGIPNNPHKMRPPLQRERVQMFKETHSSKYNLVVNGELTEAAHFRELLETFDGAMAARAFRDNFALAFALSNISKEESFKNLVNHLQIMKQVAFSIVAAKPLYKKRTKLEKSLTECFLSTSIFERLLPLDRSKGRGSIETNARSHKITSLFEVLYGFNNKALNEKLTDYCENISINYAGNPPMLVSVGLDLALFGLNYLSGEMEESIV